MSPIIPGILIVLIFWIIGLYGAYLQVTWPDRERERTEFRLRVLEFGLENELSDAEIIRAVCAETVSEENRMQKAVDRLDEGASLVEALREQESWYSRMIGYANHIFTPLPVVGRFTDVSKRMFPRRVVSILRAGEKSGNLREMVNFARGDIGLERLLSTRMNMQLLYPLSLILGPGLALSTVYFYVNSAFSEIFGDVLSSHKEEPLAWLLTPGQFALVAWGLLLLCGVGYLIFRNRLGARRRKLVFTRVLSSALALDVEEDRALGLAGEACDSWIERRRAGKARNLLEKGFSMEEAVTSAFPGGERLRWFFDQAKYGDAAEAFDMWSGMLRDRLERRADVFAQAFSTLVVLSVGVCISLIGIGMFQFLITVAELLTG